MGYALCKEFPAISPFDIDRKPYHDVVTLFADMRRVQIRYGMSGQKEPPGTPGGTIRRPAGDNWF